MRSKVKPRRQTKSKPSRSRSRPRSVRPRSKTYQGIDNTISGAVEPTYRGNKNTQLFDRLKKRLTLDETPVIGQRADWSGSPRPAALITPAALLTPLTPAAAFAAASAAAAAAAVPPTPPTPPLMDYKERRRCVILRAETGGVNRHVAFLFGNVVYEVHYVFLAPFYTHAYVKRKRLVPPTEHGVVEDAQAFVTLLTELFEGFNMTYGQYTQLININDEFKINFERSNLSIDDFFETCRKVYELTIM